MAKQRYTRKQLKQPDEFVAFSQRAWIFIRDNRRAAIIGASAAALVCVGISLWAGHNETRAEKATVLLTKAVEAYNTEVHAEEPGDKTIDLTKTDSAPEEVHFETRAEKLTETAKQIDQIVNTYSGSSVADIAVLIDAGVKFDQGSFDEAIVAYQNFLKASEHADFRQIALEGIAYSLESLKKWDDARAAFDTLAKASSDAENASFESEFHGARILALQGKQADAIKQFRRIIKESRSEALVKRAGQQLALIEG